MLSLSIGRETSLVSPSEGVAALVSVLVSGVGTGAVLVVVGGVVSPGLPEVDEVVVVGLVVGVTAGEVTFDDAVLSELAVTGALPLGSVPEVTSPGFEVEHASASSGVQANARAATRRELAGRDVNRRRGAESEGWRRVWVSMLRCSMPLDARVHGVDHAAFTLAYDCVCSRTLTTLDAALH